MYQGRAVLITLGVLTCAAVPLLTAWAPLSLTFTPAAKAYAGNHAFLHETGIAHAQGWEAFFRDHKPGYLVSGLRNGGDVLPKGTYRYTFYLALRTGHLTSLLSSANDVVRLEVVDLTSRDVVAEH